MKINHEFIKLDNLPKPYQLIPNSAIPVGWGADEYVKGTNKVLLPMVSMFYLCILQ